MIQVFEVPLPPSANSISRRDTRSGSRGHHHPSSKYLAWKKSLGWLLRWQKVQPQETPCRVSLLIIGGRGWRINADIDNRLKPMLDGLTQCGILEDDDTRYLTQEEIIYVPRELGAKTVVRCFVRLSPPAATWFDEWQPPDSLMDGG